MSDFNFADAFCPPFIYIYTQTVIKIIGLGCLERHIHPYKQHSINQRPTTTMNRFEAFCLAGSMLFLLSLVGQTTQMTESRERERERKVYYRYNLYYFNMIYHMIIKNEWQERPYTAVTMRRTFWIIILFFFYGNFFFSAELCAFDSIVIYLHHARHAHGNVNSPAHATEVHCG